MVWTPLKNSSQLGLLFPIFDTWKNIKQMFQSPPSRKMCQITWWDFLHHFSVLPWVRSEIWKPSRVESCRDQAELDPGSTVQRFKKGMACLYWYGFGMLWISNDIYYSFISFSIIYHYLSPRLGHFLAKPREPVQLFGAECNVSWPRKWQGKSEQRYAWCPSSLAILVYN